MKAFPSLDATLFSEHIRSFLKSGTDNPLDAETSMFHSHFLETILLPENVCRLFLMAKWASHFMTSTQENSIPSLGSVYDHGTSGSATAAEFATPKKKSQLPQLDAHGWRNRALDKKLFGYLPQLQQPEKIRFLDFCLVYAM